MQNFNIKGEQIELTQNVSSQQNQKFNRIDFEVVNDDKDNNKWYVEFNRLLHSKRCIYFYVFLIISSIVILCYSIFAYFFHLGF
jgi:hypothetical protein